MQFSLTHQLRTSNMQMTLLISRIKKVECVMHESTAHQAINEVELGDFSSA